ncbi:MAG: FMN-binding protein [Finegoldia sp.]|nr:FMN-binding protein [Finegoldia sp.]
MEKTQTTKKKKSTVYPVVFMFVLTAILTAILAFLNEKTKPIIQEKQALETQQKVLSVFDIEPEDPSDENIKKTFEENVVAKDYSESERELFALVQDGKEVAFAIPVEGPGLWGPIEGYVGISGDFKKLTGIEFTEQQETPGLGGRITEDEYKEQYRGLEIDGRSEGSYVANKPASDGNIDAISGATQTSSFTVDLVNEGLDKFLKKVDK